MVESTVHALTNCSMMREIRASILKAAGLVSGAGAAMAAMAARSSCSISFIHNSLVWCCTMNNISSCAGDSGCWALRISSRCR